MSSTAAAIQVMEFVRSLALCWKNLAAYPPGHPALLHSLSDVDRRLAELRGPAGDVTLGIANDGLIYGPIKVDATSAQKFAQALYVRGVAILRLGVETTAGDIETFLRLLAAGTQGERRRPIWDDLTAAGVINIHLQPVDYSAIQVTEDLAAPVEVPESTLWEDILRALLESKVFSQAAAQLGVRVDSADELSRMLAEVADEADEVPRTFDPDATFGIRVLPRSGEGDIHWFLEKTIGEHLSLASGMKQQNSLEQAIQLIRALPPALRKTVLRAVAKALTNHETSGSLLHKLASELPGDEVLDALRYLSSIGSLSSQATNLLQSLITVEASNTPGGSATNVIAGLVTLFGEEDIDRFNPKDHQELLSTMAVRIPEVPLEAVTSLEQAGVHFDALPAARQAAQVLLDLLSNLGPSRTPAAILQQLETIFRTYLAAGDFTDAVAILDEIREIARVTPNDALRMAIEASTTRIIEGDTIAVLVELVHKSPPDAVQRLHRLIEVLGSSVLRGLITALAQENHRGRRRRLFDFVASLGPPIVPAATSFLADERWYVVRNVLVLLRTVHDRSSLPEVRKLARHADLRVRMEAIKSLFALDTSVPPTLLDELFGDPDKKLAESAIALVGSHGIREAVNPLLRLLHGSDFFGARRGIRMKAIRALGEIGDPTALSGLQPFLISSRLPWPAKEERYVAWSSLEHYPQEARRPFVEKGLRSSDLKVRAICERLPKR
ncbi:MAG: HEAT repeat domain-containing protein [Thermoanaerobaculia bacterium]